MIKIYIINLKNSKKRLEKISNNLNNLNVKFERFDAIYGKTLSPQEIKDKTSFFARNFLCNYGTVGCALSHITLWKEFEKSDEKFVLICEDDVEYNENFPKFLEKIDKIYTKTNFDFLSLNTSIGIYSSFSDSIFVDKHEFNKPFFPLTMASYILSKKGVSKLLTMIDKIDYHIDFTISIKNLFSNNLEYYYLKNPKILNTTHSKDSNLNADNNGILNCFLENCGLEKINWFLSTTACCVSLNNSFSVYSLILIIITIVFIAKRKYILLLATLVELFLITF
jgi:glycosyl transferase family 25